MNTLWREKLSQNQDRALDEEPAAMPTLRTVRSKEDLKIHRQSLFWVEHHSTLGNHKKVFPVVMCIVFPVFICALDIVPWIICHEATESVLCHEATGLLSAVFYATESVHFVAHFVIFGFIIYWIRSIRAVADHFGIGTELRDIGCCFVVFVMVGQTAKVLSITMMHDVDPSYFVLASTVCCALSILPSLYIGSLCVLRRLFSEHGRSVTMRSTDYGAHGRLESILFCGGCTRSKGGDEECSVDEVTLDAEVTLDDLLAMRIGFEKFTQFLIREWSVENILFLVEVKQYKARCRELLSYTHDSGWHV